MVLEGLFCDDLDLKVEMRLLAFLPLNLPLQSFFLQSRLYIELLVTCAGILTVDLELTKVLWAIIPFNWC